MLKVDVEAGFAGGRAYRIVDAGGVRTTCAARRLTVALADIEGTQVIVGNGNTSARQKPAEALRTRACPYVRAVIAVLILRRDLVRAVPPGLAVIDVDETVWLR